MAHINTEQLTEEALYKWRVTPTPTYTYIASIPGIELSRKFTLAFNVWLKVEADVRTKVDEIVSLFSEASLLVNDIDDNSPIRRGAPSAYQVFSPVPTLNTANHVYLIGVEKSLQLGGSRAVQVFSEQLVDLRRGQGMEVHWRDSLVCPTEEEYEIMAKRKMGGLFGLAIRLMQAFSKSSKANEDYTKLTDLLGVYVQIRDDYENLQSADYAKNKTFCEDLSEGKFSFPIIHAIRKDPNDGRVFGILRQRTQDDDLKKYAVSVLTSLGSLEYTEARMERLNAECRAEIARLGGNSHLESVLDDLRTRSRCSMTFAVQGDSQ